jgi:hypothetical protein
MERPFSVLAKLRLSQIPTWQLLLMCCQLPCFRSQEKASVLHVITLSNIPFNLISAGNVPKQYP